MIISSILGAAAAALVPTAAAVGGAAAGATAGAGLAAGAGVGAGTSLVGGLSTALGVAGTAGSLYMQQQQGAAGQKVAQAQMAAERARMKQNELERRRANLKARREALISGAKAQASIQNAGLDQGSSAEGGVLGGINAVAAGNIQTNNEAFAIGQDIFAANAAASRAKGEADMYGGYGDIFGTIARNNEPLARLGVNIVGRAANIFL